MGVNGFKVQLFEGGVKWVVPAGVGADHGSGAISKPDASRARAVVQGVEGIG